MKTDYDTQAETFLSRHGLTLAAKLSNTKEPAWAKPGEPRGNHYVVTISRKGSETRLRFDFWGSINDKAKGKEPSAYDALACISGDTYCPETFADFCGEYGYDTDSIRAAATFKRCNAFAKKLRAFFSSAEHAQLAEIQ